jgi:iron-sulfur cluster repair protein YtfE (RIC family)
MTMTSLTGAFTDTETVAATPIRDLVERYPDVMMVLEPLGIDLCCGGAHPLGEALDLHGIDRDRAVPQVVSIIAVIDAVRR